MIAQVNDHHVMTVVNDQVVMDALNAEEGAWKVMPFPEDKIPKGHRVASISGTVKDATFLVVAYWTPGTSTARHDGTCVLPPFTMVHLSPSAAQAAWQKGKAWLERNQKPVVPQGA